MSQEPRGECPMALNLDVSKTRGIAVVRCHGRIEFIDSSGLAEERCVAIGIERLRAEVRYIEIIPGNELFLPLK